jgi:hypothetical protein
MRVGSYAYGARRSFFLAKYSNVLLANVIFFATLIGAFAVLLWACPDL